MTSVGLSLFNYQDDARSNKHKIYQVSWDVCCMPTSLVQCTPSDSAANAYNCFTSSVSIYMGAIDNDRCSAGTTTASPSVAVRVHGLPSPEIFACDSDHKELCYHHQITNTQKLTYLMKKCRAQQIKTLNISLELPCCHLPTPFTQMLVVITSRQASTGTQQYTTEGLKPHSYHPFNVFRCVYFKCRTAG